MSKRLLFILIILSLTVSPVSAQINESNRSEFNNIKVDGASLGQESFKSIEMDGIEGYPLDIDIYRAYEFNLSNRSPEWANVSFSVNNTWLKQQNSSNQSIFVLNGPYKRHHPVEIGSSDGKTTLLTTETDLGNGKLIIGRYEGIGQYLEIKSNNGRCGYYLDPYDELSKVEDCRYSNGSIISSLSVFTSNLALEIIDVSESLKLAFLIPLLLLAYFLLSKLEGKLIEKKIERTTQKLIKAGKSGKINLGRTALKNLELANEKAYNQNYREARLTIDKINSKYLKTSVWRKEILFLLAIVLVLAVSLRVLAIGPRVMWWDELFSWWLTRIPFTDSLTVISNDVHPPFYYFLLRTWSVLAGGSEFAFRFFSIIFSILGIYYVFLVGRLLETKAAIFSTVLVTVSWYHVIYSVEIRFYALMSLLSLMSIYHLIEFLDSQDKFNKAAYILSTVLLVYTHVYGFFIILAQTLFFLWIYYEHGFVKKIFQPHIATLIGILPLVGFYVYQRYYLFITGEQDFWIEAPGISDLIGAFEFFSGSSELLFLFFMLVITSLYGLKFRKSSKSEKTNILLWLYLITSVIVPWIISYTIFPMFRVRYLIVGAMAFYILAGYGLSKIPDFPIQIIVIGIILAVSGFSLHEQVYSQEPDEPWDEVVNHIESDYDNQSNVLYNGHWVRFAFEKYGEKNIETHSIPQKHMYDPDDNYKFVSAERNKIDREDIDKISSLIESSDRTWLVLSHEEGMTQELLIELDRSYENMKFHDYNSIELYEFYN